MLASKTIALWNVLEIWVRLFRIFNDWRGLYFWSIMAITVGIYLFGLADILFFLDAWSPLDRLLDSHDFCVVLNDHRTVSSLVIST